MPLIEINLLNLGQLFELRLLSWLSDHDMKMLCQTNRRFHRYCKDPVLSEELYNLRVHNWFPKWRNSNLTRIEWKTYYRILNMIRPKMKEYEIRDVLINESRKGNYDIIRQVRLMFGRGILLYPMVELIRSSKQDNVQQNILKYCSNAYDL